MIEPNIPRFSDENEWKYRHPRKILVFLHISKTAGSTVRRILQESFGKNLLELYDSLHNRMFTERESRFIGETFPNHLCMTSHNFSLPLRTSKDSKIALLPFTFLRNPAERVISEYYYALSRSKRGLIKRRVPKNFLDWHRLDLENPGYKISSNLQRDIIAYGDTSLAETRIREELFFTGITERFDESMVVLRQMLNERGYKIKPWILKQNETRLSLDLKAQRDKDRFECSNMINDTNSEDQKIYALSIRMLDKAIEGYRGDFEKDLHYFRLARMVAGPYYYHKDLLRRLVRKCA